MDMAHARTGRAFAKALRRDDFALAGAEGAKKIK
jgi:hypothetical protein